MARNLGGHILLAGLLAGVCVCVDLENFGPRNADAFQSKHEVKIKPVNLTDWLSIKVDGIVLNQNSASGVYIAGHRGMVGSAFVRRI